MFVPGFLLSLPLTTRWAAKQCPGEPQCVLIAIVPSFFIGVLVAIASLVYFLLRTNSKIRQAREAAEQYRSSWKRTRD